MSAESNSPLRVILFTDVDARIVPAFGQILQAAGHRLVAVVTGPGPKSRRNDTYLDIVRAAPPEVDVIVTTHIKRLAKILAPYDADLFWVFGFLRILPQEVFGMPPFGTVNAHAGLLPKYRGPNPIGWAFRNDDGQIGWTIHRVTSEVDGGPILAQGALPYGDDDEFESMVPRWAGMLPQLAMHALARIVARDPGDPQDESQAGYAGAFEPEWRHIDWSQPARSIHNQVRSLNGFRGVGLGAWGQIEGAPRLIVKTTLPPSSAAATANPGDVIELDGDTMVVQCGDGPLRIVRWQSSEAG